MAAKKQRFNLYETTVADRQVWGIFDTETQETSFWSEDKSKVERVKKIREKYQNKPMEFLNMVAEIDAVITE